jgi:hypothetical protein
LPHRTRLKNRLHSVLHHCLIPMPEFDLFSQKGRAWLKQLALSNGMGENEADVAEARQ